MLRFFSSFCELEPFSRHAHTLNQPCQHCSKTDQWVSHGYIYKQSGLRVGKRILCSKRYGRSGCGRTRALYLQHVVPQRRYTLPVLLAFVLMLIQGNTVEQAYAYALGHHHVSHRQAWRWLKALWAQMGGFRTAVSSSAEADSAPVKYRSRRLTLLLPTLQTWLSSVGDKYAAQWITQRAFC